jgi:hypothetical protein
MHSQLSPRSASRIAKVTQATLSRPAAKPLPLVGFDLPVLNSESATQLTLSADTISVFCRVF